MLGTRRKHVAAPAGAGNRLKRAPPARVQNALARRLRREQRQKQLGSGGARLVAAGGQPVAQPQDELHRGAVLCEALPGGGAALGEVGQRAVGEREAVAGAAAVRERRSGAHGLDGALAHGEGEEVEVLLDRGAVEEDVRGLLVQSGRHRLAVERQQRPQPLGSEHGTPVGVRRVHHPV